MSLFDDAMNDMNDNQEKTSVDVFKITEDRLAREIQAIDDVQIKEEKFFNSDMIKELVEVTGVKPPKAKERKPITQAQLMHYALTMYRVVMRLKSDTIDVDTLFNICAMICRDDGIDFEL